MFKVITLSEAQALIQSKFGDLRLHGETVILDNAMGRFLAIDIISDEFVPAFDRSTVDGFAVVSRDLRGCSDSIPAILRKAGESPMGEMPTQTLQPGECFYVPTGGALPQGADAMVMIEFVEDFGAGEYAFVKPMAPGANMIFKGEDLKPGDQILPLGKQLNSADIGTLASMGMTEIEVFVQPKVAVISTGDELVPAAGKLTPGKIRDVNTPMLAALLHESGAIAQTHEIVPDQRDLLREAIMSAIETADVLLVSGGTSVGEHDNLPILIEELGKILVHGIAIKPGKPTIIGQIGGKPVFGLPGNPVAAFFMFRALVKPLLYSLANSRIEPMLTEARLTRAISSNHGREEVILVRLEGDQATPVPSKSGLISTVSKANGYFLIPRDREGLAAGDVVHIIRL
ncbi:MAG: molybdopterin molybdotransferase MoeA [Anaerolineaceae bacterium]|nr:molybdopterin molybdotransferase MoeA [Anaerolineaceae bacterium]MDD4043723.1 molybdopterin molybdotransferase MoeA [Anaerolineaceae bacterium]